MNSLQFVLPWVLTSGLVSLGIGFYLGRSSGGQKETAAEKERAATLKVLSGLLNATEQLTTNVHDCNSEMREVGQTLIDMDVDGELGEVQAQLLKQIATVLEANLRLEDDLTYTRLQMEEQAREIDRTRQEALVDVLSGVGNRKAIDEKLQLLIGAWRREQQSFALVLCDVDHFKWINDTHGHQAGDYVIERVGELLQSGLRDHDFAGRFGGDEFALLLPNVDLVEAAAIAERLRKEMATYNFDVGYGKERVAATFSIGVAVPERTTTPDELLQQADQALYKSKHAGRNTVHCFQSAQAEPVAAAVAAEIAPAETTDEPA